MPRPTHAGAGGRTDPDPVPLNINVHSIHFDADRKLVGFIQEKLEKLTVYHDRIQAAEVFLRLEHDSENR